MKKGRADGSNTNRKWPGKGGKSEEEYGLQETNEEDIMSRATPRTRLSKCLRGGGVGDLFPQDMGTDYGETRSLKHPRASVA